MLTAIRDFLFQDIYQFAALIEKCVTDPQSFFELELEDEEELVRRLLKPEKLTLLHAYIFRMIVVAQSRAYRTDRECYEDEEAARLILIFKEYGIPFVSYSSRPQGDLSRHEEDTGGVKDEDAFYNWFLANEDAFFDYWTQVTDEVFHIVFFNRRFLERFGSSLADYVKTELGEDSRARALLGSKIKRIGYYPSWLKTAVFHRDHGRCVFCLCDLSGLIATDRRLHIDHIVPLNRGGSNDPSNFQLLCEDCNLEKSDGPAKAGRLYIPWWDY